VVGRHRRHRVDDDVGVGVAGLDSLHQLLVIADEILHGHASVVGAQHDHNGVQRLMGLEQHRKCADAVKIGVQMAHVVAYRRAAVEAFFNYMPALA